MLFAKFVWNWSSNSGEEDENVKSLQQQGRWKADKLWSDKLNWAFSSGEPIIEGSGQSVFLAHLSWKFKWAFVIAFCLSSIHLSNCRSTMPISTKLGIKHPWVKGIQVCSNTGIYFSRPIGPILTKLDEVFANEDHSIL